MRQYWPNWKRVLAVYVLALLPLEAADAQEAAIGMRIDTAIEQAAECLDSFTRVSSDELWFLLRAQQQLGSPELRRPLERLYMKSERDGLTALLDPSVSEEPTPVEGPEPWQDLIMLMRDSVNCQQGDEPSQELQVFIAEQHEGYVLTHQILAIQWARYVGCAVPTLWRVREHILADRVEAELRIDEAFGDLFTERLAVLALAGRADALHGPWLARLLQAQDPDGCWRAPRKVTQMRFRNYTLVSKSNVIPRTHTTSLAVCALAHYRIALRSANDK